MNRALDYAMVPDSSMQTNASIRTPGHKRTLPRRVHPLGILFLTRRERSIIRGGSATGQEPRAMGLQNQQIRYFGSLTGSTELCYLLCNAKCVRRLMQTDH